MPQARVVRSASRPQSHLFVGLARTFLAGVVFLVPIFFLPGLNDVLELPKAAVFTILTLAAAVAWTLSWITTGELRWRRVPGWSWLLALTVVAIISTFVSDNRAVSLIGFAGYLHDTLPVILSSVLFVILAVQLFDHANDVRSLAVITATSLGLAALQALLQVAGASLLPFGSLQSGQLLILGNAAGAFSVLMAVLVLLSIALYRQARSLVWRILTATAGLLGLLALLSVDSPAGWISLMVGAVVALVAASMQPLGRLNVVATALLLVVTMVGLLAPTASFIGNPIVSEVQLDQSTSWSVASAGARAAPLFGSGPSTFYYDFQEHRPTAFNASPLTGFSFVKGSDAFLTLLPSIGVLGVLALLGFIAWVLGQFIRGLDQLVKSFGREWDIISALFGVAVAALIGVFFTAGTTALMFMVWLSLAILILILRQQQPARIINQPIVRTAGTFGFVVAILLLGVTAVWSTRMVLADRELVNVSAAVKRTEDLNQVIARIDRTIRLVPQNPLPYFLRAQAELIQAQLLYADQKTDEATPIIAQLIRDAEVGITKDPKNSVLYATLGALYKEVGTLIGGAGAQVVDVYAKAAELDPNNPRPHVDFGQALYLVAIALKNTEGTAPDEITTRLERAKAEFETALRLYPANADAQFGLVLVDEANGQTEQAYQRLTDLTRVNPGSAALWYELAIRQIERKETEAAKLGLNRALQIEPNFAPAHLQLGIIAEQAGDLTTARSEYTTALGLDPNLTQAQERLDKLPAASPA